MSKTGRRSWIHAVAREVAAVVELHPEDGRRDRAATCRRQRWPGRPRAAARWRARPRTAPWPGRWRAARPRPRARSRRSSACRGSLGVLVGEHRALAENRLGDEVRGDHLEGPLLARASVSEHLGDLRTIAGDRLGEEIGAWSCSSGSPYHRVQPLPSNQLSASSTRACGTRTLAANRVGAVVFVVEEVDPSVEAVPGQLAAIEDHVHARPDGRIHVIEASHVGSSGAVGARLEEAGARRPAATATRPGPAPAGQGARARAHRRAGSGARDWAARASGRREEFARRRRRYVAELRQRRERQVEPEEHHRGRPVGGPSLQPIEPPHALTRVRIGGQAVDGVGRNSATPPTDRQRWKVATSSGVRERVPR